MPTLCYLIHQLNDIDFLCFWIVWYKLFHSNKLLNSYLQISNYFVKIKEIECESGTTSNGGNLEID